jgi:thiol-disulfide isomerase/thioredoxin
MAALSSCRFDGGPGLSTWDLNLKAELAMNGNRRQFIGACAVALAAAGIGLGWAKHLSAGIQLPPLGSEGNSPSFNGASAWLNSSPLTPADLSGQGKAVVVQFWTYTCVNWTRTLPYIRAWADRYSGDGLVVVGVHTPEFSFEHDLDNVQQAAKRLQVNYPVAIDNDYAIWNAFENQYWPALYFIDANGRIRHHHFGEGAYDESERVIQQLLTESGAGSDSELVTVDPRGAEVAADWDNLKSPETYLGWSQTVNFASPGGVVRSGADLYSIPAELHLNQWALGGNWSIEREPAVLNEAGGRIAFQFHARDLNLVMGPTTVGTSSQFRVLLDGQGPGTAHGFDVDERGFGTLSEQRLYQLIRQSAPISDRRFEIEFVDAGAAAYDFTFG